VYWSYLCNVQIGITSKKNAHQFEKLKPELRDVRSAIYIYHHSPIHQEMVSLICILRCFTNVTVKSDWPESPGKSRNSFIQLGAGQLDDMINHWPIDFSCLL